MKFVNPKELLEISNLLAASSKEALGLLQASFILNEKFPRGISLSNEEMIRAVNFLTSQSDGILSYDDSLNIVRSLYKYNFIDAN